MTEPRLLLDEMLSGTIADQLRQRGYDVIAVVEDVSLVSMPDEELLAHAAEQQRVLVTANIADFAAMATDWRARERVHEGIVYVAYPTFGQGRSFIGALVDAHTALYQSKACRHPGRRPSCAECRDGTRRDFDLISREERWPQCERACCRVGSPCPQFRQPRCPTVISKGGCGAWTGLTWGF